MRSGASPGRSVGDEAASPVLPAREIEQLVRGWSGRFSDGGALVIARDVVTGVIGALQAEAGVAPLEGPAKALGVLRGQQSRSATSLVEDVLALRPLIWGRAAADPGAQADLAGLLLLHDRLSEVLDQVLCWAVDSFVVESTRVLARQATRDPMTRLANRSTFQDALERAVRAAPRAGAPALVLLDLDGFKAVNDEMGHLVGDDVLVTVATAIASAVRPGDVAARFGGDEFAVVLPGTPEANALRVARRILRAISHDPILATVAPALSASMGVAAFDEPGSARALVRAADAALYRSKRAGGAMVSMATPEELLEVAPEES